MRRVIVFLSSLLAVACLTAAGATSSPVTPLSTCNVPLPRGGKATPLRPGVTYEAKHSFPIVLRFTPPDGSWSGAQCKTSARGPHSKKPPFFGWVGAIQTPSTPGAAPHGATYEPTSHVTIAGFSGIQFDGTIIGNKHVFIPFTPQSRNARYYGDAFNLEKGAIFRIIVLQVRTKTIVVFIEPADLPQDQFPAFLAKADSLLKSLRFPT